MPYIVRLNKSDGTTINLPESFPDPIPCHESVIIVPHDGGTIHAIVDKVSQMHSVSPYGRVDSVQIIYATQIQWTEYRTGNWPGTEH